jgi:ankyrin repeat protein
MTKPDSPPESPLHRAARLGDIAMLEILIAQGADINSRADLEFDYGSHLRQLTPLMVAARSIDGATVETLRWLLEHGADLHARSEGGNTAAWYAAGDGGRCEFHECAVTPEHVRRLEYLLDAGLDPHECSSNGRSLLTEACRAGDPARVSLLLQRGVSAVPHFDPEQARLLEDEMVQGMREHLAKEGVPEEFLDTEAERFRPESVQGLSSYQIPLFCAVASGSAECVRLILAAGADPNTRDSLDSTPLMQAGSGEVVRVLIDAGADLHAIDSYGKDALQTVLEGGCGLVCGSAHFDIARALLDAGADIERRDKYSHTRLYSAAFSHADAAVEFLLSVGADPHAEQGGGYTPLHAICWQGEYQDVETNEAAARIIDLLVGAGSDVNGRDKNGNTPMHEAASGDWGNPTAIRTLLRHGAEPDLVNESGLTPLMLASSNGDIECVRELLAARADPTRADARGKTAVDCAKDHYESWVKINEEPPTLDFEFYEDPEVLKSRHLNAIQRAAEGLKLLHEAAGRAPMG